MEGVAVVIVCHNYAEYLGEAIESVQAQQHVGEVLVVDDASDNDEAAVIAEWYKTVRYLRINARCQHEARRTGFHHTTAPFLCFLDGDDRLGPGYIELAVKALANPEAVVAYTDLKEFGNGHTRWRFRERNIEDENFIHSASVVRRSALEQSRVMDFPLPDSNERFADWWMWRHVLHGGGRAVRTRGVLYYRRHGDNLSMRQQKPTEFKYCRDLVPIWERP